MVKKQGDLCLETHDALLASNKLLSDKIEELDKRLEVLEVANLSIYGVSCNFCEKAHESCACLPTSLGLSEEQVNYMGAYDKQQQNPYFNIFYSRLPNHQKNLYKGNNNFQPPQPTNQQQPKKDLEEIVT